MIRPIDEPSLARIEHDWDETVAQLLYLSPEIRRNKIRIKQNELELISAKNQILPEVNLSLLYRWVGVGDTLGPPSGSGTSFPEPGSSALGELTGGNYQEGVVRLDITPPAIGMRRELSRIRNAQLRLNREHAFLQEQERLLVSQMSDAVAKVATHYQLVQTNAQRWQAAEQEVEARLAEFKGGRSPVNVVLQSQQRRAQAQIDYYRALGEYNKSVNYVDYLKGTMLANNNITLAEGPWNDKAYCDALERARERSAGKQLQYGVSRPGVVRTGPLRDADAAMDIIGNGISSVGQAVPPNAEGRGSDPLGLNLEPYRDPVDVNDIPLSEMGGSSQQLLSPNVTIEDLGPAPGQMPAPERSLPALPQPEALPDSMSLPSQSSRSGGGVGIDQINHEETISVDYAPQPVKRTPLPTP